MKGKFNIKICSWQICKKCTSVVRDFNIEESNYTTK